VKAKETQTPQRVGAREAAYMIGVSKERVVRLVNAGSLPGSFRDGDSPRAAWCIPVASIEAYIRERVAVADVPLPFRGSAIAMITAGLMSLGFMGFAGLVRF
jgi:hypothetical protein